MSASPPERSAAARRLPPLPGPTALICLLLVLAAGARVAWLAVAAGPDDTLARVQASGVLRVGYSIEAPWAWTGRDGPVGAEVEVARAVAARLGHVRLEWFVTDFHALIPELLAGRYDMIAAGLFVTPGRARRVLFSRPTAHVGPALLMRADDARDHATFAAVAADPQFRLAVLRGAVEAERAQAAGVPAGRILTVPDAASGIAAVQTGHADGLALSAPTLRALVHGSDDGIGPRLRVHMVPTLAAQLLDQPALAFRPGDARLHAAVDAALADWLGSPEHLARVGVLGFTPEELAPRPPEPAP